MDRCGRPRSEIDKQKHADRGENRRHADAGPARRMRRTTEKGECTEQQGQRSEQGGNPEQCGHVSVRQRKPSSRICRLAVAEVLNSG